MDKARLRSYEIGRSDDWRSPAGSAGSDNRNCSDLASVRILAIFKLKFEPCEKKTLVLVEIVVNTRFFAVEQVAISISADDEKISFWMDGSDGLNASSRSHNQCAAHVAKTCVRLSGRY